MSPGRGASLCAESGYRGSTIRAVLGLFSLRWIPYGDGKKKWFALGIAGLWTWPAWLIAESAKLQGRFSFLSALIYFLIVSVVVWGVFVVADWLRHRFTRGTDASG